MKTAFGLLVITPFHLRGPAAGSTLPKLYAQRLNLVYVPYYLGSIGRYSGRRNGRASVTSTGPCSVLTP